MSIYPEPEAAHQQSPASRYWAGAVVAAVAVALTALVGVLVFDNALNIALLQPWPFTSRHVGYPVDGAIVTIVAAAILQLLILGAPRPLMFFTWLVFLVTVVVALVALTKTSDLRKTRAATAAIVVVVGIAGGTSLRLVAGRTLLRPPTAGSLARGYPP